MSLSPLIVYKLRRLFGTQQGIKGSTFRLLHERKKPRCVPAHTLQVVLTCCCWLRRSVISFWSSSCSLFISSQDCCRWLCSLTSCVFFLFRVSMSSFSCDWSLSSRLCNVLSRHTKNALRGQQGQSPGVIHFKYEFPTKKAGQTTSILYVCVFQAAGKRTKPETNKDVSMKIHGRTQHS